LLAFMTGHLTALGSGGFFPGAWAKANAALTPTTRVRRIRFITVGPDLITPLTADKFP
jgi:hypothetical protein